MSVYVLIDNHWWIKSEFIVYFDNLYGMQMSFSLIILCRVYEKYNDNSP